MADCGASGSALDRTTARILSSALTGGQGSNSAAVGEATNRAGKAVGAFLGNVSTAGGPGMQLPGAAAVTSAQQQLMPSAPPEHLQLQHPLPSRQSQTQHGNSSSMKSMDSIWNNGTQGHMNQHQHQHQPPPGAAAAQMMGQPIQQLPPHIISQQHQRQSQMHANMQMQMQMQMMNQQMAMMQMNQRQQAQMMNNQRQKVGSTNSAKLKEATNNGLKQSAETQHQQQQRTDEQTFNDVINDLPADFESYMKQAEADSETLEGHEGYTDGVSIEELAKAWAEAEKEIGDEAGQGLRSEDDAADYLYGSEQYGDVVESEYQFSEESTSYGIQQQQQAVNGGNKVQKETNMDLMEEGMKHFNKGDIAEAILCFESELRNIDPDNADAWLMLGKCHAENDEDQKAILCLENAVERDPYSSEAMLALGVSYVNELNHDKALKHLKDWVTHNPTYAGMGFPTRAAVSETENTPLLELKSLLQAAVDFNVSNKNEQDSADALEALGVCCSVSREYGEAVKHFQAATSLRPDNHQLWNKLGATLANSSRSDEALPAYHKALSLKPKYARVWLNMAISHSNLKNYDEAARCYLQTLSLNPDADHIWSYLRISLTCSERWDLLPLTTTRNLQDFKQHYDFVQY